MAASRRQLLSSPRSGARPLYPAAGEPEGAEPGAAEPEGAEPGAGEPTAAATPAAQPKVTGRAGEGLAGLITGLFVWGFTENWLRGGKTQANAWLKAKFINETSTTASTSTSTGKGTVT